MEMIKDDENYISFFHSLYDKDIMKYEMNEAWLLFILKVTDYILNEWDDMNPLVDQLYDELYYFSKKLKYHSQEKGEKEKENHWLQWIRFIIYHCRSTIYYYQKNWIYTIIYCKKSLLFLPSDLSSESSEPQSLILLDHLSPLLYQKFISLQLHTIMLLTSSKKHHQQMNKFKPSTFIMKHKSPTYPTMTNVSFMTSSTMLSSSTHTIHHSHTNHPLPILNTIHLNENNSNNNNNDSTSETSETSSPMTPTTRTINSSSSSSVSSNTVMTNASAMICSYCFTEKKNMPVCAQCKIQIYCSIKCLKLDKQRHFDLCQKYQDY
ncbi:unnamed protein product [Cunninghamella blakesleeana]